jgi:hypothetical protein
MVVRGNRPPCDHSLVDGTLALKVFPDEALAAVTGGCHPIFPTLSLARIVVFAANHDEMVHRHHGAIAFSRGAFDDAAS